MEQRNPIDYEPVQPKEPGYLADRLLLIVIGFAICIVLFLLLVFF